MKKVLLLAMALLAFGYFAGATPGLRPGDNPAQDQAAQQSWTGVVSDNHCGVKHSAASDDAATCVGKCVSGGAKYVLVSGGKVYQLDAQDKFKDFAGKSVKVSGTLNGDTINVASVEAAG